MNLTSEFSKIKDEIPYAPHNYSGLPSENDIKLSYLRAKKNLSKDDYQAYYQEINSNKEVLNKAVLGINTVNAISEELRNLEILAKNLRPQRLIYEKNNNPSSQDEALDYDVFIGGNLHG